MTVMKIKIRNLSTITVTLQKFQNFGMRIPAIKSDFKADICHAIGQKRPFFTVRLNMKKNMILRHLTVTLGQKGHY